MSDDPRPAPEAGADDPVPEGIPAPAHPTQRREPLPWTRPKPDVEDPGAQARVQAILASPTYRQADQDVDFLNTAATRGVRLQLDYFKPQTCLEQAGVQHTIVVFGSTRIPEPAAARRRLAEARAALAQAPDDAELRRRVQVAERIVAKSRYYEEARRFGQLVGRSGMGPADSRLVLMTGGGPGMMEAANRGAFDVGAKTVGLNITLPHEQYPNPYLTPELTFRFHYFAIRKLHFLLRARALVVFPGGYGTLDELFEVLTLVQTRKIRPLPIVLVGRDYWQRLIDFDLLVAEGTIDPEDAELFWYAEQAEEIWEGIQAWYRRAGRPLINGMGPPADNAEPA